MTAPRARRGTTWTTNAQLADLFHTAAGVITIRGLHKGDHGSDGSDPDHCAVCTLGALNVAAYGSPFPDPANLLDPLIVTARARLREVIGEPVIGAWNDRPGTTRGQVVRALSEAAARAER